MSHLSPRAQAILGALGIGALAAVHLVALLTFLNPHLPFGPRLGLQLLGLYAPLLAGASLLLHVPLLARSAALVLRALPWSLTLVLLAAAILAGVHASHLAYYLPSGINVRLIKAAVWLGLGAVAAFYTALLHSLRDRPYGIRSRTLLWILALASLIVVVERRDAYEPRTPAAPLPSAAESEQQLHLLVVGADAATMDALLPLVERDRLPFFGTMLRSGAAGRLGSLTPSLEAPLWTSLATGKYPYKHGVVGPSVYSSPGLARDVELRVLPRGILFSRWALPTADRRAVSAADRRAATVWETLERLGISSHVIGWPLSGRTPENLGDGYPASGAAAGGPVPTGAAALEAARRADARRLDRAGRALAGDRSPSALFIRLPGTAVVSRQLFGGYVAHQLEGASGEPYAAAADRLAAFYRDLDDALAELWRQTPEPRLLAFVSPYGVRGPPWWHRLLAELGGSSALGGRVGGADGTIALRGDDVRSGATLRDASLVDLVPTLLYALGLPSARDLDGRVLTAAFTSDLLARRPVTFVPSYEALLDAAPPGGDGDPSPSVPVRPNERR